MTVSGGRGNAHNATTRTSRTSGGDVINVGISAGEEKRRHDRYCAPDCSDDDRNDRSIAAFRWLIGRR